MDEAKNTTTAETMMVEEGQETTQEVSIEGLMENLDNPPVEEPATEAGEEKQEEEAQNPEEAQRAAVTEGLKALVASGCTNEFLEAFTKDAKVHADIAAGKSVESAAIAYMFRNAAAPAAKQHAKKSVPTVKSATGTATKKTGHAINEMSDKDFAELDRRAREALLNGKTVSFG